MGLSRRSFLASAGAALTTAASAKRFDGLHIGVTDWNLQQTGKLEAVRLAKILSFDGVQISLGRKPVDDKLPLDNAEMQAQYLQQSRQDGIHVAHPQRDEQLVDDSSVGCSCPALGVA